MAFTHLKVTSKRKVFLIRDSRFDTFAFRFKSNGFSIDVAIYDKLDIICPRRGRDDGEELFYFKLYLVSKEDFQKCNITSGRRLITCDVPEREKKYTFYFQQLSPSPWGLEFDPDKSYYVVCKFVCF